MEGIPENTHMSENDIERVLDHLDKQDKDRDDMKVNIKVISETVIAFQKQYDYDMRGEPKINGYKGLIGEVQTLKEAVCKYPSFLYLLAKNPSKTFLGMLSAIVVAITTWFALHTLASIPVVEAWFLKLLGLS